MSQWLSKDVVNQRAALADEGIGILTATIERLRAQPDLTASGMMRKEAMNYGD